MERFDWFSERIQTREAFGWLSERSSENTSRPMYFLEINRQWIDTSLRRHTATQLANLLHIRVFFGRKTKRPCFDLYIYWLTKQIITNTNWNHFSRSYENRSIDRANTNMSNRGRRGTRIVYYSSILVHSLKVSLFCNVIFPQSPASVLYCLVSHWNYDKPVEYFRVMPGHSPLATTAWHERQWAPRHKVILMVHDDSFLRRSVQYCSAF